MALALARLHQAKSSAGAPPSTTFFSVGVPHTPTDSEASCAGGRAPPTQTGADAAPRPASPSLRRPAPRRVDPLPVRCILSDPSHPPQIRTRDGPLLARPSEIPYIPHLPASAHNTWGAAAQGINMARRDAQLPWWGLHTCKFFSLRPTHLQRGTSCLYGSPVGCRGKVAARARGWPDSSSNAGGATSTSWPWTLTQIPNGPVLPEEQAQGAQVDSSVAAVVAESPKRQQDGPCTDGGRTMFDSEVVGDNQRNSRDGGDGGQHVIGRDNDGEMERVLEKKVELIWQYEDEKKAQMDWKRQFNGNWSSLKKDFA